MGSLQKVQRRTTGESAAEAADQADPASSVGHLSCPFCNSYDVDRLYVASLGLDSCECSGCGARWDEERTSGQYRGRANRSSVLAPRPD